MTEYDQNNNPYIWSYGIPLNVVFKELASRGGDMRRNEGQRLADEQEPTKASRRTLRAISMQEEMVEKKEEEEES